MLNEKIVNDVNNALIELEMQLREKKLAKKSNKKAKPLKIEEKN